jgi:hypothetical protein
MASNGKISEYFISKLRGRKFPCSYFRYRPGMSGQPRKTSLRTLLKHELEASLLQSSCPLLFRFNVKEMFPVRWHCSPTLAECLPKLRLRESTVVPQPSLLYPCPTYRDSFRTNCENLMFGNLVWYLCWQIYGFVSAVLLACCPGGYLIKLNFREF